MGAMNQTRKRNIEIAAMDEITPERDSILMVSKLIGYRKRIAEEILVRKYDTLDESVKGADQAELFNKEFDLVQDKIKEVLGLMDEDR